jgi:diguanylate cyclase (GGDEF)-like protein
MKASVNGEARLGNSIELARPGPEARRRVAPHLGSLPPHRKVQLLCAVAMLTLVAAVGGVQLSLHATSAELAAADSRIIPAIQQLDVAQVKYGEGSHTLQRAAQDPNAATRAASFNALGDLNTAGASAWKGYQRLAAHLPHESALQKAFVHDRGLTLAAGVALLTSPTNSAATLAGVTRLTDAMRTDLDKLSALYEARIRATVSSTHQQVDSTARNMLLIAAAGLLLLGITFAIAARSMRANEREVELRDRGVADAARRNDLEARLQRSLEMVHTEEASYRLIERSLRQRAPGIPAELLLADSSRAHFRQATTTDEHGGPGCGVMSPTECPATVRGQTQIWVSSADLDACPYLADRASGACSAVCVPVSIAGNTVGVVHATHTDGHPLDSQTVADVELISRKAGERIGMLRLLSRSETQAHTDPLTGLMNRRSLEVQVRDLVATGIPYVAAYGDLDLFKQLNDVYGHDAGDRALRLFARVLRDSMRPNDIPARYGGEEFVVVIPECTVADAYAILDRLRERLAAEQLGGAVPPFTVSFGLAASHPEMTFSETVERADAALLEAKSQGRDRIVIDGAPGPTAELDLLVPIPPLSGV